MKHHPDDPVADFLDVYHRTENELLGREQLEAPGVFEGEKEFIAFAERDYNTNRPWAFEIKPEECALIVVDLQEDFVNPAHPMCVPEALRQIPRVKELIAGCRQAAIPVFYTEHHIGSDCAADFYEFWPPIAAGAIKEGARGTKVYHGLDPQPGERIISVKHTYDSFAGTDLDYVLRSLGKKTVIVCGTLTNFCCESTARTAYFLNYHVVFGDDVNASDNALAHEATVRTMRRGLGRVMGYRDILKIIAEGDAPYHQARAARSGSASAVDDRLAATASQ
jgi:nicotinamidase-related amidase